MATIRLSLAPDHLTIKAGERAEAALTLTNAAGESLSCQVRLEGAAAAWTTLSRSRIVVSPGQELSINLRVEPALDSDGGDVPLSISVVDLDQGQVAAQVTLNLTIVAAERPPAPPPPTPEPEPVASSPEAQSSGALPGAAAAAVISTPARAAPTPPAEGLTAVAWVSATPIADSPLPPPAREWSLTLKNTGRILDYFGFRIEDLPPAWCRIRPAQVQLYEGQQTEPGAVRLTVRPPDDTPAREYLFRVVVFSTHKIAQSDTLDLSLRVESRVGFAIDVSPAQREGEGDVEFTVTLMRNDGVNIDQEITLSASDRANACSYEFSPSPVVVLAATKRQEQVRLRARGLQVLKPNEQKSHLIAVQAESATVKPPPAQVQFTQIGVSPPQIEVRPAKLTARPAEPKKAVTKIVVTNDSAVETVLALSAIDPEGGCSFDIKPSTLRVPARREAEAVLTIEARYFLETDDEKEFPFQVRAMRLGEQKPVATADGSFTQLKTPPILLTVDQSQREARDRGKVTFTVTVSNPRPEPVQVHLEAWHDSAALDFSFAPPIVSLSPHADGESRLSVRCKDKMGPTDRRRTYPFTIRGNVSGAQTAPTTKAVLVQIRPWLPAIPWGKILRWTVFALVVIVVVLFLLQFMDVITARAPTSNLARALQPFMRFALVRNLVTWQWKVEGLINIAPGQTLRPIAEAVWSFINTLTSR